MMASFTLEEAAHAAGGVLLKKGSLPRVEGVSTDTRSIPKGSLFIALKGERFDGHRFLKEAAEKGAAAVIVSDPSAAESLPEEVSVISCGDTLKALEGLAHFHRMRFSIPVVAVTGSNGKTTTKNLTAALLSAKYQVCRTEKNFNNEIGLSKTLLSLTDKDGAAVVEMGMRGAGQIAELCRIASPTVGIITNVGPSHIGILGSMENIAAAKRELVEALDEKGTAILNDDDPFVAAMVPYVKGHVVGYGVDGSHTVQASRIRYEEDATRYMCACFDEVFPVHLHLLGIHNVYDALAATAAARILGVNVKKIQKALSLFEGEAQRQTILHIGGAVVMDDSYNANPLSMEMAFRSLKQMKGKRRILVLGDMAELGAFAEEYHRKMGRMAAAMGFDKLIAVGPLSRLLAKEAVKGGLTDAASVDTPEEAAALLAQSAGEGDLVLIKGSHSMEMDRVPALWKGDLTGHGI